MEVAARSAGALLREGAARLAEAGLARPHQDGEWLLAGLLGLPRWQVALEPELQVAPEVVEQFLELVGRRCRSEPLQYLLGWEEFRGLRLGVSPAVLIPRLETELLVEWALELLSELGAGGEGRGAGYPPLVIDLGTGNGAIALALAHACSSLAIYAVDRAPGAVALARDNAATLGLADRVLFREGDLFAPLGFLAGKADLVVSNPPYIPSGAIPALPAEVRDYEPLEALNGGPDGMSAHRRIIVGAPRFLKRGGWLLLEMGEGHSGRLRPLLERVGFTEVQARRDLSGVERMIGARWEGRGAEGGAGANKGRGAEGGAGANKS